MNVTAQERDAWLRKRDDDAREDYQTWLQGIVSNYFGSDVELRDEFLASHKPSVDTYDPERIEEDRLLDSYGARIDGAVLTINILTTLLALVPIGFAV